MVERTCKINLLLILLFVRFNLSISEKLEIRDRNSDSNLVSSRYKNFKQNFVESIENEEETSQAIVEALLPAQIKSWVESDDFDSNFRDLRQYPNMSARCSDDLEYWLRRVKDLLDKDSPLNIFTVETWVLHMLDAWGKFPAGILSGHINSLGDWDECVELEGVRGVDSTFSGRYCTILLVPNPDLLNPSSSGPEGRQSVSVPELIDQLLKPAVYFFTMPSIAGCYPSTCSREEITIFLNTNSTATSHLYTPLIYDCSTIDRPELHGGNIAMISVLSLLAALCISATFVDVFVGKEMRKGLGIKILLSFSLYTNVIKCLNTKSEAGMFGSLHGIRFFSTCWVVFGHSNLFYLYQPFLWNTVDLDRMYEHHWTHYSLLNGFYSVDTFFAMSGMLACLGLLKAMKKSKGKVNIPMLYLHRYLRITPTYALIIGLIAAIFPLIGRGPWWIIRTEHTADHCQKGWWRNLLYIQNLWSYDRTAGEEMCQGESWYIANDMQFFILMPIFVYLIWRWRKIGLGVLAVASVGSIIVPGIVTYVGKLPPVKLMYQTANPLLYDMYDKPWYRIGPYLVGLFMGFILYKTTGKPLKLPKWAVALGWTCSTVTACCLIFLIKPYYDPDVDWSVTWSAIYAGLSHYLWGAIIMWIVFACQFGYGGWINDFLSWKVFMPLGRLTFCVYMSSTSVQEILTYQFRNSQRYAVYEVIQIFFAHLVTCFLVGFLLTVTMESPFIQLEKIVFGGLTQAKPKPVAVAEKELDPEIKANV